MPWRAPGTSKPLDSCGIASGFLPEAAVQYAHTFSDPAVKQGAKGSELERGARDVFSFFFLNFAHSPLSLVLPRALWSIALTALEGGPTPRRCELPLSGSSVVGGVHMSEP